MKFIPLTSVERRSVAGLATVMATRLLGLFLILPVFALYAERLTGHTPFLVGLALGAYGLTQALLQLPFGMLSDRFGRKSIILAGLAIFAIGSVVAAMADSIIWVIVGRALQGAGAISAVVVAMVADLTREAQRTKAMAIIGISIGASFVLSLMMGPVLGSWIDVNGIFWLTAVLAICAMAVIVWVVPTPERVEYSALSLATLIRVVRDSSLLRLNIGIFVLHGVLTALFVAVPVVLVRTVDLPLHDHWQLYLPMLLGSLVVLVPMVYLAERRGHMRAVFVSAVIFLASSQVVLLGESRTLAGLSAGILLFFIGFNFLEAVLPSLVSRTVDPSQKGTAIGVYSSFQFLGAFAGGTTGGFVAGRFGFDAVFAVNAAFILLWLVVALTMPVLSPARTH